LVKRLTLPMIVLLSLLHLLEPMVFMMSGRYAGRYDH
jgi:hypothetical protein